MELEFERAEETAIQRRLSAKRRVAAGVGAAMLVAAAGGVGFGLGRSASNDEQVFSPADQPRTEPPALPTAPAGTDGPQPPETLRPIEEAADEASSEPGVEESAPADFVASGGPGYSIFGSGATEVLAERVTDSGIVVRAHLGSQYEGGYGFDESDGRWQPPAWCFESGQVRLALGGGEQTGRSVIDVASVSWWAEPFQGRSVSWVTMGRADENPHRVLFVHVSDATTSVTAVFGDGASDTANVDNGTALLVVPGAPTTIEHSDGSYTWFEEEADFQVTFTGGAEPAVIEHSALQTWNNPEFQASCSPPPPALPEPGEQPADAATAETEIAELMSEIYGPNESVENSLDFIHDPVGVEEARQQVREGSLEDSAASAEAVVEELVFTTPNEAWFRYRIETINGIFSERYGIAVFVDEIWKISRETICQDLAMAGGTCGPGIEPIRPPGT